MLPSRLLKTGLGDPLLEKCFALVRRGSPQNYDQS